MQEVFLCCNSESDIESDNVTEIASIASASAIQAETETATPEVTSASDPAEAVVVACPTNSPPPSVESEIIFNQKANVSNDIIIKMYRTVLPDRENYILHYRLWYPDNVTYEQVFYKSICYDLGDKLLFVVLDHYDNFSDIEFYFSYVSYDGELISTLLEKDFDDAENFRYEFFTLNNELYFTASDYCTWESFSTEIWNINDALVYKIGDSSIDLVWCESDLFPGVASAGAAWETCAEAYICKFNSDGFDLYYCDGLVKDNRLVNGYKYVKPVSFAELFDGSA